MVQTLRLNAINYIWSETDMCNERADLHHVMEVWKEQCACSGAQRLIQVYFDETSCD